MKAQGLRAAAALVRKHGQRKDSVLAHINPQEARFLKEHFGGDTNPHTGLPQYGKNPFKSLEKAVRRVRHAVVGRKKTNPHTGEQTRTGIRRLAHSAGLNKVEKAARPIIKTVLPAAGSAIGMMLGGPGGAMLGGGLGNAMSSKRHPWEHGLYGLGLGALYGMAAPWAAGKLGVNPDSTAAKLMGYNAPSFGEQFPGLSSFFDFGKGSSAASGATQAATPAASAASNAASTAGAGAQNAGGFGGILKSIGIKDALDAALLGTAVLGAVGNKQKPGKDSERHEDVMARISQYPDDGYKGKPLFPKRKYKKPPPGYRHGHDPEWEFFEDEKTPDEGFARGGYVKGDSGGQDDDVHMDIPAGAYVMDATTVSLLGDGNSDKGAEKVRELESKFMKTGIAKMHRHIPAKPIKAAVSDGEYIIPPEVVTSMGKGDNRKGSKVLDKMRKKLRAQKGVKKFLPPKSKHIDHYMR